MPSCTKPIKGFRSVGGKFTMKRDESYGYQMQIPCGFCIACRRTKQDQWAIRCYHEHKMYEQRGLESCFIHPTYDDAHLPKDTGLDRTHLQKLIQAIRDHARHHGFTHPIRYFAAGEYGSDYSRPHYHINLFGWNFPDRKVHKFKNGKPMYTSQKLESLWTRGFIPTTEITMATIKYTAKYLLDTRKKMYKEDPVDPRYVRKVDGAEWHVPLEFQMQSTHPGLGHDYAIKYMEDLFPSGYCIENGKKVAAPPYYHVLCERHRPDLYKAYLDENPRWIETLIGQAKGRQYQEHYNNTMLQKKQHLKTSGAY